MSYFSQFRHLYSQPERDASDVASRHLRRVERELEKVQAIEGSKGRLCPANQLHIHILQDFLNEKSRAELDVKRSAERVRVAPSDRNRRDHQAAISRLFNLSRRVERLREVQGQRRQGIRAAKPSGGDRRSFNFPSSPTALNARTVYGTEALVRFVQSETGLRPFYKLAQFALPCIQREVRREVLFASRKAGKGWRRPHRFTPSSLIGC